MRTSLPVAVHISRPMQVHDKETCAIQITDKVSGCLVVEVRLTFAELAALTLTHGDAEGTAEYRLDNLGKTREVKTEIVQWDYFVRDKVSKAQALAPFEADGWVGSPRDLGNHHKSAKNVPHGYTVGFVRYVKRD